MTQGTTVETSQSLTSQLARRGFRVTNLAQGGNGPLLDLAILRAYGLRLRPKNVICER